MYNFFSWPYACCFGNTEMNNSYKSAVQGRLEAASKASQVIMQNAQSAASKNIAFMQKQSQNGVDVLNEHFKAPEKAQDKAASVYNNVVQDTYNHLKEMNDIFMKCTKELIDLGQEGVSAAYECAKSAKTPAQR